MWFADVDQLWLEFVVAGSGGTSERSSRRRTVPLVDNFPLMAWISRLVPESESPPQNSAIDAASHASPSQTFCSVVRLGTKDIKAQVGPCFLLGIIYHALHDKHFVVIVVAVSRITDKWLC